MGVSPCPDCSAMHTELLRQNGHADPIGAGCSHSVHFVLSQPCSSASPWLCRRRDEWVVGLTYRLDSNPRPLIPRGNKPLNPWSSVPAALHCFHPREPAGDGGFLRLCAGTAERPRLASVNLFGRLLLVFLRWRRREPLGLWDTAVTPFRVVPSDLDVLGHMNNGKYLSLMDLGRMDLMLRSGFWAKVRAHGWYPVVAGQTITYRKSLNLAQRFELRTAVLGFDDRWIFMEQTFTSGDVVYAHAVVRARFLKQSGGSVSHDEIAELAGGYPDLNLPEWLHGWTEATKIPASAR